MRTRPWIVALAGVFVLSAAHAQTAPAPAPPAQPAPATPAPAQGKVDKAMRLGTNIGDLVKAAYEQQQAARLAAQAKPGAKPAADADAAAVEGAEVAAASRDSATTPIP